MIRRIAVNAFAVVGFLAVWLAAGVAVAAVVGRAIADQDDDELDGQLRRVGQLDPPHVTPRLASDDFDRWARELRRGTK